MISKTARKRRRQERMGARGMAIVRNMAKARHLTKIARKIEQARMTGKPEHGPDGRFLGVRKILSRITKVLRFSPQYHEEQVAA